MKPITNLLLVVALICYIFLPFYDVELLKGGMTGFVFTASTITDFVSVHDVLFALLPFASCFAAITFNCMRHRYWGIAASLCILVGIYFFAAVPEYHAAQLTDPEVAPAVSMAESMQAQNFAIGYHTSYGAMVLALISAIISLMPFKFNRRLEETIDHGIEKGIEESRRHIVKVGTEIHDEFGKLDRRHHKQKTAGAANAGASQPAGDAVAPTDKATNTTAEAEQTGEAAADETPIETAEDVKPTPPPIPGTEPESDYSRYMPKE